jgi:hypothetical protein
MVCPYCNYNIQLDKDDLFRCYKIRNHLFLYWINSKCWKLSSYYYNFVIGKTIKDYNVLDRDECEYYIWFNYYNLDAKRFVINSFKMEDSLLVGQKLFNSYKNLQAFT